MKSWCLALLLAVLGGSSVTGQSIHDVTKTNPDFGYRYFGGTAFQQGTPNDGNTVPGIANAYNSNGVFIRDRSRWNTDTGYAHALDNEIRFVFRGSGVDIKYLGWDQSDTFHWELDGVTSGSLVPAGPIIVKTIAVAAQGTLDADQLHLLRLWITDDSGEANNYKAVFIDTIQVYDEQPIVYSENTDPLWQVSGGWTETAKAEACDGSLFASGTAGDTIDIDFSGTSIAIIGGCDTAATGTYTWRIDDGSQFSGTVDQSLDVEAGFRWPDVVINGLAPGNHTLSIEVGAAGALSSVTGAWIDRVAVIGTVLPVELSGFELE